MIGDQKVTCQVAVPVHAIDAAKHSPQDVAAAIVEGVLAGDEAIVVDELSRNARAALAA
jgi:hypothetical protein